MGANVISNTDMGYIFEEFVRRFLESYNEQAETHFTSRDIYNIIINLLITEE